MNVSTYTENCTYICTEANGKTLKTDKMKNLTNTITVKEVRTLNIKENDVLGFAFERTEIENNYLLVNGKRVLNFTSSRDRQKSYDKIRRMHLGLGWAKPQLTDEERGLIQAVELGLEIPKAVVLYR